MSWISSRQDPTGCLLRFRVPFAKSEALSHEELGVILIEATTKMALSGFQNPKKPRHHVFFLGSALATQVWLDPDFFCHEVWATCSWLRHAAPNNCKVPEGKRQCTIYLLHYSYKYINILYLYIHVHGLFETTNQIVNISVSNMEVDESWLFNFRCVYVLTTFRWPIPNLKPTQTVPVCPIIPTLFAGEIHINPHQSTIFGWFSLVFPMFWWISPWFSLVFVGKTAPNLQGASDVPGVPSRPPGSGMAAEMANGLLSSDWAHQSRGGQISQDFFRNDM